MCGICGLYYLNKQQNVSEDILTKMNNNLYHRGPDGEGYYIKDNIGFGHRRLSIIDVCGGAQPIFNENKSIVVICNGEIYNHKEKRQWLKTKGHRFTTHSDTEVIVHLYEEKGLACVDDLQGMFAFALWDSNKKLLLLARDRIGIKPLVYRLDNNILAFASEIKGLFPEKIEANIKASSLSEYFSLGYITAPNTIFENIYKLPPGHILCVENGKVDIQSYWDLDFLPQENNWETIQQDLPKYLKDAVMSHLESEVPLGAFLSGGVDSSAVVATMALHTPNKINTLNKINTFTIGFEEKKFDETEYANAVAARYNTKHHQQTVTAPQPQELQKILNYFDEPFADSSIFPTYIVCREARKNITVAISGDGGDENFAGYDRYYIDMLENNIRSYLPLWLRNMFVKPLAQIYPKADYLPRFLRLKTLLQNVVKSPAHSYYNSLSIIPENIKKDILRPEFYRESSEAITHYYNKNNSTDFLKCILYTDIKTYLADDILTKMDICSMANSLEVRVPLLDHSFVEYAFSIPSKYKLHGKVGKYVLKKNLESVLDSNILYRKKMGFSIPIKKWVTNELSTLFSDIVLNGQLPYFDYEKIRRWHNFHVRGISNQENLLWSLLIFHLWYQSKMQ